MLLETHSTRKVSQIPWHGALPQDVHLRIGYSDSAIVMGMMTRRVALFVLLVLMSVCGLSQSNDMAAEQKKLSKLEASYTLTKKSFVATKKPAAKKSYLAATLAYANGVMYSPALKATVKYPKALRLYREVLAIDPKNTEAKESRDTIEAIYKSMNRPIPK